MNIILRKAALQDLQDIYTWRNDPVTCQMSINTQPVTMESHSQWFKQMLIDSDRVMYVAEINGTGVGVTRFDVDADTKVCEVSINLNPDFRGQGLSLEILQQSIVEFCKKNNTDFFARIKKSNKKSISVFEKAGFILKEEVNDILFFYKTIEKN